MEIHNPGALLPQQPPILMLDKIVDIEPGVSGTGTRVFRAGDPCFHGHFPDNPILPGVLIVEALAQTAMAVLAARELEEGGQGSGEKPAGFLAKINDASFYKAIAPNQEVAFQIKVTKKIKRFFMIEGQALRDGERCARAKLTLAMGTDGS